MPRSYARRDLGVPGVVGCTTLTPCRFPRILRAKLPGQALANSHSASIRSLNAVMSRITARLFWRKSCQIGKRPSPQVRVEADAVQLWGWRPAVPQEKACSYAPAQKSTQGSLTPVAKEEQNARRGAEPCLKQREEAARPLNGLWLLYWS